MDISADLTFFRNAYFSPSSTHAAFSSPQIDSSFHVSMSWRARIHAQLTLVTSGMTYDDDENHVA